MTHPSDLVELRERALRAMQKLRPTACGSLNDAAGCHHDRLTRAIADEFDRAISDLTALSQLTGE